MTLTPSGDYSLPGPVQMWWGNLALRVAAFTPAGLRERFLSGRARYQILGDDVTGDHQGVSERKWDAMQMPQEMKGQSVLDIGCSEGFFALQCARRGAAPVVGVDSNLGRLLVGLFTADQERLRVRFRMGVFPGPEFSGTFDYVICLSVLHHSLVTKDLWRVLTDPRCEQDRRTLRTQLGILRSLTSNGGRSIIEMPYEYEWPEQERSVVDFQLFCQELLTAGFAKATCLGTWDYNPTHRAFKDRIIYVAQA